jgi:hypothetical protein
MESANGKVRNNITCSTNCKYRTAATLHMACFMCTIVNTPHKAAAAADDDDDEDNNNRQ